MALDVSGLESGLAAIFEAQLPSGAVVASKIAAEYDSYCKNGQAVPGIPIMTGVGKKSLESILSSALSSPMGTALMVAMAFSQGIQAYWMLPPVAFVGGPSTGVVTAMPGAGAVIGPIAGALKNIANTEKTISVSIASALDIATRTVMVTYSTPTVGPPPPAMVI